MKIKLAIIVALGIVSTLNAQDKTPKYSNEFLNIGVGARALGMSNAVTASTKDVTAGYWNPSGLLNVNNDIQIGLMHASYFAGIAKYDYGAVAHQADSNSAFSFSVVRFGVDNIPNTTELIDAQGNINYDNISYFSAADLALIFSYARRIKNFDLGGNFKIINRKIGDFAKSWGFGLDASLIYHTKKWNYAIVARDVTTTFNAWSYNLSEEMISTFLLTGNKIPTNGLEMTMPKILLGAARDWKLSNDFSLLTEIDADLTTDGKRNVLIVGNPISIAPHLGLELNFRNLIYVRGGAGNAQRITDISGKEVLTVQPNLGLGVRIKGVAVDYALANIGSKLYSNIFSLRFNLNNQNK